MHVLFLYSFVGTESENMALAELSNYREFSSLSSAAPKAYAWSELTIDRNDADMGKCLWMDVLRIR